MHGGLRTDLRSGSLHPTLTSSHANPQVMAAPSCCPHPTPWKPRARPSPPRARLPQPSNHPNHPNIIGTPSGPRIPRSTALCCTLHANLTLTLAAMHVHHVRPLHRGLFNLNDRDPIGDLIVVLSFLNPVETEFAERWRSFQPPNSREVVVFSQITTTAGTQALSVSCAGGPTSFGCCWVLYGAGIVNREGNEASQGRAAQQHAHTASSSFEWACRSSGSNSSSSSSSPCVIHLAIHGYGLFGWQHQTQPARRNSSTGWGCRLWAFILHRKARALAEAGQRPPAQTCTPHRVHIGARSMDGALQGLQNGLQQAAASRQPQASPTCMPEANEQPARRPTSLPAPNRLLYRRTHC